MGQAAAYDFDECTARMVTGRTVTMPAGRWWVSELSSVVVKTDAGDFTLPAEEFMRLKLERKARPV